MNKKYIIRKNEEIKDIIAKHDKKIICDVFIIYKRKNNLNYNKYCISITKKIGKANIRNLFKRRIKDILMKNNFNNSNDYVIILRKAILEKKYLEINDILKKYLERK